MTPKPLTEAEEREFRAYAETANPRWMGRRLLEAYDHLRATTIPKPEVGAAGFGEPVRWSDWYEGRIYKPELTCERLMLCVNALRGLSNEAVAELDRRLHEGGV